jgi:hypothetical protein
MTGNDGGDPDVDELDDKIENAWMAGKDVGTVTRTSHDGMAPIHFPSRSHLLSIP